MSSGESTHVERLYGMLPHYVCGLVWLIDALVIVALLTTPPQALASVAFVAQLFRPFKLPEIVVGFILAAIGVLLPYAAARAFNPVAETILNLIMKRLYKQKLFILTEDHVTAAGIRIIINFGVPPPKSAWSDLLRHYLIHIKSPAAEHLWIQEREIQEGGYLAFPFALLMGLAAYIVSGQSLIAALFGIVVLVVALVVLGYRGTVALQRWNEHVTAAFLVISPVPAADLVAKLQQNNIDKAAPTAPEAPGDVTANGPTTAS